MLPALPPDRSHLSLSELLRALIDEHPSNRIGPVDLAEWLGERALAGLLMLFALFHLLPLPPGVTTVTGLPLLLLSGQLALGRTQPWFPAALRRRALTKKELGAILGKFLKWEHWIERLFRPRLFRFVEGSAARIIGVVCMLLSLEIMTPIPFAHHIPALTVAVFALAIIYRDGLAALAGAVMSVVSFAILTGMIFAGAQIAALLHRLWFA